MSTKTKRRKPDSKPAGNKYPAIGLRPDDALRERAQALASAEERSLAQMCSILIREALDARGK
jgi:hypothetical protein